LGLRQQVEHYYNAAKSVQNTEDDNKCTMVLVCHQPDPARDLNIPYITEVTQERSNKHHDKIKIHSNIILWPLLEQQHRRRLKKSWPVDLIDG
jgi:hypothetical protein